MPAMHVTAALAGTVHWVVQSPQWLTLVLTSKHVPLQQVSPAWQACVSVHPGTHTLLAWKQIEPSGQSASTMQPAQELVVVSQ